MASFMDDKDQIIPTWDEMSEERRKSFRENRKLSFGRKLSNGSFYNHIEAEDGADEGGGASSPGLKRAPSILKTEEKKQAAAERRRNSIERYQRTMSGVNFAATADEEKKSSARATARALLDAGFTLDEVKEAMRVSGSTSIMDVLEACNKIRKQAEQRRSQPVGDEFAEFQQVEEVGQDQEDESELRDPDYDQSLEELIATFETMGYTREEVTSVATTYQTTRFDTVLAVLVRKGSNSALKQKDPRRMSSKDNLFDRFRAHVEGSLGIKEVAKLEDYGFTIDQIRDAMEVWESSGPVKYEDILSCLKRTHGAEIGKEIRGSSSKKEPLSSAHKDMHPLLKLDRAEVKRAVHQLMKDGHTLETAKYSIEQTLSADVQVNRQFLASGSATKTASRVARESSEPRQKQKMAPLQTSRDTSIVDTSRRRASASKKLGRSPSLEKLKAQMSNSTKELFDVMKAMGYDEKQAAIMAVKGKASTVEASK